MEKKNWRLKISFWIESLEKKYDIFFYLNAYIIWDIFNQRNLTFTRDKKKKKKKRIRSFKVQTGKVIASTDPRPL